MITINSMEDFDRELARINRDVRLIQQQMGIEPKTIEQRVQARADRLALAEQAAQRTRNRPSWMNNPMG
jgi:primosomal protein N''